MRLRLSTKPAFDLFTRMVSYAVWGSVGLIFLFWELTGDLKWTPWKTLSETGWDIEKEHPETKRLLEDFLLGLAIHIRYRTTLESSVEFASELRPGFDEFLRGLDYV